MVRARLEKLTQHILERPLFHLLDAALEEMLGRLQMGDRLLVSELSRLGRSLGQVIQIVDTLVHRNQGGDRVRRPAGPAD